LQNIKRSRRHTRTCARAHTHNIRHALIKFSCGGTVIASL